MDTLTIRDVRLATCAPEQTDAPHLPVRSVILGRGAALRRFGRNRNGREFHKPRPLRPLEHLPHDAPRLEHRHARLLDAGPRPAHAVRLEERLTSLRVDQASSTSLV